MGGGTCLLCRVWERGLGSGTQYMVHATLPHSFCFVGFREVVHTSFVGFVEVVHAYFVGFREAVLTHFDSF